MKLINKLKGLKKEFEDFLNDTNKTLDEKWKFLVENEDLGDTCWRTNFGLDRDDSFLYEYPLYMEKHDIMPVKDILEVLIEDDEETFNITPEEIIAFKQYCVDKTCSKMKFDW